MMGQDLHQIREGEEGDASGEADDHPMNPRSSWFNPKGVKFWLLVFAMLCMSRGNPEQCLYTVLQISNLTV